MTKNTVTYTLQTMPEEFPCRCGCFFHPQHVRKQLIIYENVYLIY